MKHLALIALLSSGCATLFADKTVRVSYSDGASNPNGDVLNLKEDQVISYPDGRTCVLDSGVNWGWFVIDLFTTGPIGIIVDGVTGNWSKLKGECPGVVPVD